jgi:hypothetical protein
MSKKVYICGAITGRPESRADIEFDLAEMQLSRMGYEPVNPMKLPHDHPREYADYMKEAVCAMIKCDAIHLLPNWMQSRGAMAEYHLATVLNMPIVQIL